MKLNQKNGEKIIVIPCIYNSGRKAYVRVIQGKYHHIDIQICDDRYRPYQMAIDSYLHIDKDKIAEYLARDPNDCIYGRYHQEAIDIIEAIKAINKHYFSGTLIVDSDECQIAKKIIKKERKLYQLFEDFTQEFRAKDDYFDFLEDTTPTKISIFKRIKKALKILKKQYETIEVVEPLNDAHLGGTWQNYYDNKNWFNEAEAEKGSTIFLA